MSYFKRNQIKNVPLSVYCFPIKIIECTSEGQTMQNNHGFQNHNKGAIYAERLHELNTWEK